MAIGSKCEGCGWEILEGQDFILIGKYPSQELIKTYSRSPLPTWIPPQIYGAIYHKKCYREYVRKKLKISV